MKNFDEWNKIKKETDGMLKKLLFREKEIWFIKMGENIGFEQNGKGMDFLRPILVYKKFNKSIFIGLPLTRTKKDSEFYCNFIHGGKNSTAILSQIRLFDSKRLVYRHGKISRFDFDKIKEKLIELLQ